MGTRSSRKRSLAMLLAIGVVAAPSLSEAGTGDDDGSTTTTQRCEHHHRGIVEQRAGGTLLLVDPARG